MAHNPTGRTAFEKGYDHALNGVVRPKHLMGEEYAAYQRGYAQGTQERNYTGKGGNK